MHIMQCRPVILNVDTAAVHVVEFLRELHVQKHVQKLHAYKNQKYHPKLGSRV